VQKKSSGRTFEIAQKGKKDYDVSQENPQKTLQDIRREPIASHCSYAVCNDSSVAFSISLSLNLAIGYNSLR